MQINNTIFEKKHHYMIALREIDILRKQMEYEALNEEISKTRLQETYRIWNMIFVGLLREGLEYQYIRNAGNPEMDMIRLTIDNIDYNCKVTTLKGILKSDFENVVALKKDYNKEETTTDISDEAPADVFEVDTPPELDISLADNKHEEAEYSEVPNSDHEDASADELPAETVIDDVSEEQVAIIADEPETGVSEYPEESQKSESTFVFDRHELNIMEPGAKIGEKIEVLCAPLYMGKNLVQTDIAVRVKCRGEVQNYFSTKDRKSVIVNIADQSFIVRGSVKNGKFASFIMPYGMTLSMNNSLNDNLTSYPTHEISDDKIRHGHIVKSIALNDGKATIHIIPTELCNDENGAAPVFGCIETDGERKPIDSATQKNILVSTKDGIMRIICYWENGELTSEMVMSRD